MNRLDPAELDLDIRRNHYLIGRAITVKNWPGVQRLAEGLARLSLLRLAAAPEPPTRHFQGSFGPRLCLEANVRRIPPARPA